MTAETNGQISMSVASGDHVDGSGGSKAEAVSEDHLLSVRRCETPRIGHRYYRMTSDPRGFCLIFNVFEFPHLPADDERRIRKGSEGEAKRLSQVFQQLHFKPKIIDNPKKEEIESVVEEYSKNPELKEHDCIVVIVLSHGRVGGFEGSDGKYIPFKEIVEKLNNKNCSALINKPKLFFFSCCRGSMYSLLLIQIFITNLLFC